MPSLEWGWLGKCSLTLGKLVKLPPYGVGLWAGVGVGLGKGALTRGTAGGGVGGTI